MTTHLSKNWLYYVIVQLILLAMLSAWLYQKNQPVKLISPNLKSQKIACVSYAPYYGKDQSPFVLGTMISPEQIDADLTKLAQITDCVRTYSVGQGMDYVPKAAEKVGLKVYLGAWIGWTNADNEKEVNLATKIANAYPNTVKALIIGNEVFLRQEQNEAAMQRYIAIARKQTKTPITYADVWEFWNKHKAMEAHVDFITVHILPYWEDNPVDIDHAVLHANNIMTLLGKNFTKPILIGETGWPSVGRQRNQSAPSLINQARYVREFLQTAEEKKWQYNIIEAIDQPWKRNLEGTVGGYWGLLNTDLTPKFSLTTPISARSDGLKPVYYALIGAAIFLLIALVKNKPRNSLLFAFALLGASSGLVAMLQIEYLITACRDNIEFAALGGTAVLGWLALLAEPWLLSASSNAQLSKQAQKIANFYLTGLLIASIISSYLIFTDGRYRDFPNLLFLLPAIVLAAGLLVKPFAPIFSLRLHETLSILTGVLALLCVMVEPTNFAAILWLAISLLLAFASWPKRSI